MCGKYVWAMDVTKPQSLSPAGGRGGRGKLRPEQILILVRETVNVNESNLVLVEETEHAENTEK